VTVLVGGRITLRPFRLGEFDAYLAASQSWFAPDPAEDGRTLRTRLKERFDGSGTWTPAGVEFAIEHAERLVGDIQARTNPAAMPPGVLEIGIELFNRGDRGQGLGSESLRLMAAHLFDVREAHRVQLTTDLDNASMRRAAERVGFGFEGVMRAFMPSPKGPRDYALYAMTMGDYKEAKKSWASPPV
jgi:RimJ/RimL family protein N-acetyltransferase